MCHAHKSKQPTKATNTSDIRSNLLPNQNIVCIAIVEIRNAIIKVNEIGIYLAGTPLKVPADRSLRMNYERELDTGQEPITATAMTPAYESQTESH